MRIASLVLPRTRHEPPTVFGNGTVVIALFPFFSPLHCVIFNRIAKRLHSRDVNQHHASFPMGILAVNLEDRVIDALRIRSRRREYMEGRAI